MATATGIFRKQFGYTSAMATATSTCQNRVAWSREVVASTCPTATLVRHEDVVRRRPRTPYGNYALHQPALETFA